MGFLQGRECLCPLVAEGVKRGKGEQLADPHNFAGSWHSMRLGHATVGTWSQSWGAESVPLPFTPECTTLCVPGWCLTRCSGRQWSDCQYWQSLGHRRPFLPLLRLLCTSSGTGLWLAFPQKKCYVHVWVHITCVLVSMWVAIHVHMCVACTLTSCLQPL